VISVILSSLRCACSSHDAGYSPVGAVETPLGKAILLIGAALTQSAAPLCLDADVGLQTARNAAQAFSNTDCVASHNKAVQSYARAVALSMDGNSSHAPLGLSSHRIHLLCSGTLPQGRCVALQCSSASTHAHHSHIGLSVSRNSRF
jgi:hypothetical protein